MPLTKPNQDLRRNLKAAAFALDDAAQELFREAKGYAEPEFLETVVRDRQKSFYGEAVSAWSWNRISPFT